MPLDPGLREDDIIREEGLPAFRSEESAWGAVVSFERRGSQGNEEGVVASSSGRGKEPQWAVDVLVNCWPKTPAGQPPRKLVAISLQHFNQHFACHDTSVPMGYNIVCPLASAGMPRSAQLWHSLAQG